VLLAFSLLVPSVPEIMSCSRSTMSRSLYFVRSWMILLSKSICTW
jgi:hypothetical protein